MLGESRSKILSGFRENQDLTDADDIEHAIKVDGSLIAQVHSHYLHGHTHPHTHTPEEC
jgi:hypothetical protein